MKKPIIYIFFITVFILFQIWIRFNTSLLMHDLDETIWNATRQLPSSQYVKILTETAKEYGEYKNAYDSSVYYILGAVILLVINLISIGRIKKELDSNKEK